MADAKSTPPRAGRPRGRAGPGRRPRAEAKAPARSGAPPSTEVQRPSPQDEGGPSAGATKADNGRRAAEALARSTRGPGETETGRAPKRFKGLPPPTKDMSRKELAERYGPYVRSIAGKIKKTLSKDIEFDDLVSYGMLGLMEAADRFDAKYGANFMTFAYYRVRGAIYDGLRGMGWVSRTEYQKYRYEQHANEYLRNVAEQEAVGGVVRKSEDDEVTELADAVEGLITIYVTALDAMEGFQVADDATPAADDALEVEQARRLVAEAVEKLPEQERKLLTLYYYKELSLEEVGKHLSLSKSWTSRLHARAIDKLGRLLKALLDEYAEDRPILPRPKKPGGRKPKARSAGGPSP